MFFSDIHGNLYAFDEFIRRSKELEINYYIFCGDIFGYYYGQNAIISKMKSMENLFVIKGNHDQYYLNLCLGLENENKLVNKYGNAYKNITTKISKENREFVENMKKRLIVNIEGKTIGVFHGSPGDPINGRVYPDTKLLEFEDYAKYDYIILGHTHYRMIRHIGTTTVLNPGSLGQPRDKNGFSFATLTLPSGVIEFHEIHWDRNLMLEDIKNNDNGKSALIDILYRNEESK